MQDQKKFIVITSIFEPTDAVKKFAAIKDWHLVVVGDKKSPANWANDNTTYLGPEDQEKLGYKLVEKLPWNHYCRKMVGYLYAIEHGATMIADSDDDNIPFDSWPSLPSETTFTTMSDIDYFNVYKYFTSEFVWPRGFPLRCILSDAEPTIAAREQKVGVWQFLANEDPDVDAIYRLTNNKPIYFDEKAPIVLEKDTVCPFNSQDTIFTKEFFPLLFLPAFVTFRFTDILRGLIAQPVLWSKDARLGFGPASVVQKRNPHDYMKDFVSEIPVFLETERTIEITKHIASEAPNDSTIELLQKVYRGLQEAEIVAPEEVALVEAWAEDLKRLGCA